MSRERFICTIFFVLLQGCGGIKVINNPGSGFFIDNYTSYNFHGDDPFLPDTSSIIREEFEYIKLELKRQLNELGLEQHEHPELIIYIGLAVSEQRITDPEPIPDAIHGRDLRADRTGERLVEDYYPAGALMIDFVDVKRNELVFSSTATGIVKQNELKQKERIGKAIREIVLGLPKKIL